MTEIDSKAREIADVLTVKQAKILTRPVGRYTDDAADLLHLINAEVLGTYVTPLGYQVRAALEKQP
jgi:hypothetical protein